MRTDFCQCGQRLFFDNTRCVRCESLVGFCVACRRIAALVPAGDGRFECHHADCRAPLVRCQNDVEFNVCNWTIPAAAGVSLCESCELTEMIPNLSEPAHRQRWFQLEAAKRRLLYALDRLGLPFRRSDLKADPPLRFRFLDQSATSQPVTTGHENGLITVNLLETDAVERERARVMLNEPQRTLIGHFRHEIGHYYWAVLVSGRDESSFRAAFGDERTPAYEQAKQTYYEQGPPPAWENRFISAYAAMHPWEDFAESFAGYLDMVGLLETAEEHGLIKSSPNKFSEMTSRYARLAVIMNEFSRERGMLDLVPEVHTPMVVEKLAYIQGLVLEASSETAA